MTYIAPELLPQYKSDPSEDAESHTPAGEVGAESVQATAFCVDTDLGLTELATLIRVEMQKCQVATANALAAALNAGDVLIMVRPKVEERGIPWTRWLREHCYIAESSARLCIQLAQHRDEIEDRIHDGVQLSLRAARKLISKQKSLKDKVDNTDGSAETLPPPPPIETPPNRVHVLANTLADFNNDEILAALPARVKDAIIAPVENLARAHVVGENRVLEKFAADVILATKTNEADAAKYERIQQLTRKFNRDGDVFLQIDLEASRFTENGPEQTTRSPVPKSGKPALRRVLDESNAGRYRAN